MRKVIDLGVSTITIERENGKMRLAIEDADGVSIAEVPANKQAEVLKSLTEAQGAPLTEAQLKAVSARFGDTNADGQPF